MAVVLAVVGCVIAGGGAYLLAWKHIQSVKCGNQMLSLGFAVRIWADDNEERLPNDGRSMSNEVAATQLLVCPGDRVRKPAADCSSVTAKTCSYEIIGIGISIADTNTAFLPCKVHGHLGHVDGTVFDGKRRRTKVNW